MSGGKLYTAISGKFTIQSPPTALAPRAGAASHGQAPRLVVNGSRGGVRLETGRARQGKSTPLAVDARGRFLVPLAEF